MVHLLSLWVSGSVSSSLDEKETSFESIKEPSEAQERLSERFFFNVTNGRNKLGWAKQH